MTRRLQLTKASEQDIEDAADWYHQQAPQVIPRFEAALDAALAHARQRPLSYPVVRRDVRRVVLQRFPYSVFFQVIGDAVLIIAVLHQARDPRIWQSRTS
jgi:toxin ParE1/3/4